MMLTTDIIESEPIICIIYEFGVAILLLDYCPGNYVPGSNLILHLFFLVPFVIALLLQMTTLREES